jgi:UDP-GlcNAc:undecaprenyl-phosphate GlcNAc-1-phosphate transferase
MGDTGSMFLGLNLAVLSVMGGAKLALAFMVLGVPILDVAVVMINRIRRGQSPLHYDKTHLHYRLLATGLSVKQICYVIYGLSFVYGLLALTLSGIHNAHFYKFIGVGLVGLTMIALIIWIDYRHRGVRIPLGGPEPGPILDNDDADGSQDSRGEQPGSSQVRTGDSNLPPQNLYDGEASPVRFPR